MLKRCNRCDVPKEPEAFAIRKGTVRRGTCMECWRAMNGKWTEARTGAAYSSAPRQPCTLCGRKRPSPTCPVCTPGMDTTAPFMDVEVDMSDIIDEASADAVEPLTPSLVSFGTPLQRASAEALLRTGSIEAAAESLQLEPSQLRAHLDELQRRAATRGYAPANAMTQTTPAGFSVKGVSSYFKTDQKTGESQLVGQWVKTNRDQDEKYQALLDALGEIAYKWQGQAEPVAAPLVSDDDLLCIYPVGDAHLGLLSWSPETGNNFDLRIAEHNLCTATDRLVNLAPPAKQALIINVGDWTHSDNRGNTTTAGTPVDSDGRWAKVLAASIRIGRRLIDRTLEKHEHVTVINEIGNHDYHGAIMLSIALAQFYENEPRVTIDTSPAKFHYFVFGQNLIGVTHGDTIKLPDLGPIMACDRAEDWGRTKHRYWITGHVHHQNVKELHGCIVESFNTLAPGDAWHNSKGYRSGQNSKLLVHHRQWGQINRHVVGIDQILGES